MLSVKTPSEVLGIIDSEFFLLGRPADRVALNLAAGRVLAFDVVADEFVPGFDRSTVDGYAVIASDTFGCSESMPVVLSLSGEIFMGEAADVEIRPGACVAVSTGGDLPMGADAAGTTIAGIRIPTMTGIRTPTMTGIRTVSTLTTTAGIQTVWKIRKRYSFMF